MNHCPVCNTLLPEAKPPAAPNKTDWFKTSYRIFDICREVCEEVHRANAKHKPMHSAHEGHSVIREEFEELWEHVKHDTGSGPDARKEAIQIAAMGVRYVLDVCK